MNTYVTLSILFICGVSFLIWLLKSFFNHEKNSFTTLNKPLDNKNKWWYN